MWAKFNQLAALPDRLLRRSGATYEADVGVLRLRPWVPTNHGRDARYGDPPVVLGPSRHSAPRRTPEVRRVPAFLRPPTECAPLMFVVDGDC